MLLTYDGTNWEMSTIGNAPSGSGSFPTPETHTASSSATLDFTTCISSSYKSYEIRFISVIPATNSIDFYMQFSTNGGSTWDTSSAYWWSKVFHVVDTATPSNGTTNGTSITNGFSTTGGGGLSNGATIPFAAKFALYLNPSFVKALQPTR